MSTTSQPRTANDDAVLKLRAEDGVIFEVKAFYLKAGSAVFRDMLSDSAATHQSTGAHPGETPIDIPAHSIFLGLFVQLLEGRQLTTLDGANRLYTVIHEPESQQFFFRGSLFVSRAPDLYDCSLAIRERTREYFSKEIEADPWLGFCLGAAQNFSGVDTFDALSNFWKCEAKRQVDPATMKVVDVDALLIRWYLGYARAYNQVKTGPTPNPGRGQTDRQAFWAKVAAAFKLATD